MDATSWLVTVLEEASRQGTPLCSALQTAFAALDEEEWRDVRVAVVAARTLGDGAGRAARPREETRPALAG